MDKFKEVSGCCQYLISKMFSSSSMELRHQPGIYDDDIANLANLIDRCVSFGKSGTNKYYMLGWALP